MIHDHSMCYATPIRREKKNTCVIRFTLWCDKKRNKKLLGFLLNFYKCRDPM